MDNSLPPPTPNKVKYDFPVFLFMHFQFNIRAHAKDKWISFNGWYRNLIGWIQVRAGVPEFQSSYVVSSFSSLLLQGRCWRGCDDDEGDEWDIKIILPAFSDAGSVPVCLPKAKFGACKMPSLQVWRGAGGEEDVQIGTNRNKLTCPNLNGIAVNEHLLIRLNSGWALRNANHLINTR